MGKLDLLMSPGIHFSLKRKRGKRSQLVFTVPLDKIWRLFEIRNVIYRPQNLNNVDDHFPVAKECLLLLRLYVLLNVKEKKKH